MRYAVEITANGFVLKFDSIEDFMAAQSILAKSAQAAPATEAATLPTPPQRGRRIRETQNGEAMVTALIEAMDAAPASGLPSAEVARVCQVKSTSALGPRTKVLKPVLAARGLDIERVRKLRRTARDGAFWLRGPDFEKAKAAFLVGLGTAPSPANNGIHKGAHDGGNGQPARATLMDVGERSR